LTSLFVIVVLTWVSPLWPLAPALPLEFGVRGYMYSTCTCSMSTRPRGMRLPSILVAFCVISWLGAIAANDSTDEAEKKSRKEEAGHYSYCESDDCYHLLGVGEDAGPLTIKRAYRKLAAEWHPDRNPDPNAKLKFQKYANAYEVLSNSEMRANYDYLMANPHEFPGFFSRYSQARYAPKSDLRTVIFVLLSTATLAQWLYLQQSRKEKLAAIKSSQVYQERVRQLVLSKKVSTVKARPSAQGRVNAFSGAGSAKTASKSKKGDKAFETMAESELLIEIEHELPQPFRWQSSAFVVAILSPVLFHKWVWHSLRWAIKFHVLAIPPDAAECTALTARALGYDINEFEGLDENERLELKQLQLWIPSNLAAYERSISAGTQRSGKAKRIMRTKRKEILSAPNVLAD